MQVFLEIILAVAVLGIFAFLFVVLLESIDELQESMQKRREALKEYHSALDALWEQKKNK